MRVEPMSHVEMDCSFKYETTGVLVGVDLVSAAQRPSRILSLTQMTQQLLWWSCHQGTTPSFLLLGCQYVLPLFGPRWEVQPHLHMHSLVTREEGRAIVGVTSPPPHISCGPARALLVSARGPGLSD